MVLLQILLALCLLAACVYYLLCLDSARHWHNTRTPEYRNTEHLPPISILKPLRGHDPEQHANLLSFCRQDYPAYQVVFGALDPDDPGLEAARRLAREFPQLDIAILEGGEAFGLNRKVCVLESLRSAAKHDLLVLCDSDMRVGPDYLRRVVAPFADPVVGLVTCPYRGHGAEGLPSALEALGIGADFMPSVLLAQRFWPMDFAFGSTIALRADTLEAVGGFRALADELADDFLLGHRVRRAGYRVVLSDYVVDDVLGRESFGEMWARRLRWAKTSRAMRPAGWAGAFITHGTALGVLFLLATGLRPVGWLGLGLTFGVRAVTATWIARFTRDENLPKRLPLLPLSDLLSFALWAASFWGRHIVWRGERLRLERGGRLTRGGLPVGRWNG